MAWGCSNQTVEVRPRAFRRSLDVQTPRARRRRERRRLRNAAGVELPGAAVRARDIEPLRSRRVDESVIHEPRPDAAGPVRCYGLVVDAEREETC